MFSRIYGAVLFGLNGCLITVETDIANGLPSFDIVGLATVAVKEAKERVRTAVKNSGLAFPVRQSGTGGYEERRSRTGPAHCRGFIGIKRTNCAGIM